MKNYILLGILTLLTTLLIGIHANWLLGGTVFLLLLWLYAIALLLFRRPQPNPLSPNLVPGDTENLDKLYQRAMQYCNDIINHYQNARYTTRRYYILSQLLTATLSGLTPILVLVDRNQDLKAMMPSPFTTGLTWAMLIAPGLAAVLATTSTIFNFQEEWIQSKKTAEALEAVREEFLMGASPEYRVTARDPETKLTQRKQALENFIIRVNELHLKQVDQWASGQRTVTQQTPIPVNVENLPSTAPSSALTSQPSKALPAQNPTPQTDTGLSEDILSEDNLRLRPADIDLTPPQETSPTEQNEEPTEEEGPFLI